MSHYKPYPAYRESGVEWFGVVPKYWEIGRINYVTRSHRENIAPEDIDGKHVFHYSIPVIQETGNGCVEDGSGIDSNKLVVRCPQVLVSKLNPRKQTIIVANQHPEYLTVASTEFVPLIPLARKAELGFISYLMKSDPIRQLLESRVESVTKSHQRVTPDEILKASIAIPPVAEQRIIKEVLDRETTRIDAMITKKTRFIELLKEKRQALIAHAVTKGLDPDVPIKNSGVEWLGDIPSHWLVAQLGKISIARCDGPFGSGLKSEHYQPDGVRVIRLQNIGWASFKDGNEAYISHEHWHDVLGRGHEVLPDDVLIGGLGDDKNPLGRACVAPDNLGPAMVKADCYRFRLNRNRAKPEFIALTLSATARSECGYLATGATRDRLNLGLASARVVALPPRNEQVEIVASLNRDTARIDLLSKKTQHSIDLLKERRSALITAAVTGQIDLRESV